MEQLVLELDVRNVLAQQMFRCTVEQPETGASSTAQVDSTE